MKLFFIILLANLFLIKNLYANLMVSPTRIVIDDSNKTDEVKLINRGETTTTYRVILHHLRMKGDGTYEEIEVGKEEGEQFADNLLRFSPREVTLKPGEVQTVRLIVRKPRDLPIGEYRSHMLFKEEAPADFGLNIEQKEQDNKKISIILKPLFGVSIPIIVQNGNLNATADIDSLSLTSDEEGNRYVSFNLSRSGSGSIYGNIKVHFIPQNDEKTTYDIGLVNNISVYYPYSKRKVVVKLDLPANIKLENGVINVNYSLNNEAGEESNILAQESMIIQ